jgi:hypothetical protein
VTFAYSGERLVALVQDPNTLLQHWVREAPCKGSTDIARALFPEDGCEPPAHALALCARCPVASECLATALVHEKSDEYRHGWWGGCSPSDRDLIAAAIEVEVCIPRFQHDMSDPRVLARRLRAENHTISSIATELRCTKRTVYRYLATAEVA